MSMIARTLRYSAARIIEGGNEIFRVCLRPDEERHLHDLGVLDRAEVADLPYLDDDPQYAREVRAMLCLLGAEIAKN